ncbi:chemotaxis protein CheB [Sphingomonas morindae]|uniref:protein-glutamate methylesterase n=1 Tax=Sphingomonas morindae TaxID=1541170 RepID=A0ABY4X4E8_9SPHN|nr:chemotaxis protein CheB [Sphingomonas morindae]USI71717.1 response regulator [Sphingomonas morindae]
MSVKKVLIVDDSLTMRALFTSALEKSNELAVVGAASGADMARDMIRELRPDVITLDVEMPGKNGIEFLRELMETSPLPVVMLSTLTQKGADVSLKAIELGAVDCFPKPTKTTPDEFDKISGKLCKLVATAAKTNMLAKRSGTPSAAKVAAYQWDGSLVALSAGMGGIDAIPQVLASFPANCPPTILLHPMEDGLAEPFAAKLATTIAPKVVLAADGLPLEQGHVYLVADTRWHAAIDKWPSGRLRLVDRDPVNGHRPSADLLFGVMAKAAAARAVGVILSGGGADGAAGLAALRGTGAVTFCQDAGSSLIHEAAEAAVARGAVVHQLPAAALGAAILAGQSTQVAA